MIFIPRNGNHGQWQLQDLHGPWWGNSEMKRALAFGMSRCLGDDSCGCSSELLYFAQVRSDFQLLGKKWRLMELENSCSQKIKLPRGLKKERGVFFQGFLFFLKKKNNKVFALFCTLSPEDWAIISICKDRIPFLYDFIFIK